MSNVTYRSKHSGKEIDAAIDKIPANLPEKDSLIVVNQSGESSEYAAVSTAAEPSVVVKRDSDGKIKVISAENNDEAVNLGQLNTVSATLSKEIANTTSELTKEIGEKFDKSGGKVSGDIVADGNVTVGGNLVVNGTTSTVESTSLKVADKLIYVAKDNTEKLTTPAGIITPKYNGVEDGGIVYDNTGTAFVGDVVINAEGNVDVVNSNLQPIATRDGSENLKDNHVVVWDSDGKKLITSENDIDNIASKDYVIPNPELQGDEPELEGIQINGVKYKSGVGGAGIDTLTDVNLTSSGTTVAYDIASGVTVNSNGKFTYEGGEKEATTEVNVPIVAGEGISIDKSATEEKIVIKNTASVDTSNFVLKSGVPSIGNLQFQVIEESSTSPSQIFIYDTSTKNQFYNEKCGPGLILHTASVYYNPPFLVVGTTGSNSSGNYVFSHMSPNGGDSSTSDQFIRIATDTITYKQSGRYYQLNFPNRYFTPSNNITATICTNKTLKTLFGGQSIFSNNGEGNIDLYRHMITLTQTEDTTNEVCFDFTSSKDTQANSVEILKTLLGETFSKSASGVCKVDDTTLGAVYMVTETQVKYHTTTTKGVLDISGFTITDNVVAI